MFAMLLRFRFVKIQKVFNKNKFFNKNILLGLVQMFQPQQHLCYMFF